MSEPYLYYDRDGTPIEADWGNPDWVARFTTLWDDDKRRVAYDEYGSARISTVHLPIDHNWGEGPPLIFETMVFGYAPGNGFVRRLLSLIGRPPEEPEYQWRYATEEAARAGHVIVCAAVRHGRDPYQAMGY